ncbi:ATP-dependent helicase [Intestinimonas massiliensis (ex Afouda et al. 2020)]|uniref:ATP-dependent helicase n=1 Tax=Intestinimonas massiliensis (ex Afouda et al. 2020) TaxID=1673721 RepID=UPI001030CC5E|nr:ATP-dependent helicase [Intestinimonas massiliensis (ex Afouda et al. 2020)]
MDFSQLKTRYALHLDPQQETAVQAVDGPVLLLAVPGSGKTTVLVTRLGYMCHVRGIPPEQILTMTYTVAAARDMRARYASFFGAEEAERLAFHTINSVCSRIIRYYERVTGGTAFRLLEDGGQKSALISELYRSQTNDFATESIVKNLETAITYAKNQMLKGEELAEVQVEGLEFPVFYQSYCKTLRQRHLMDFDDQMVYALQILRRYPQILQAVQARYRWFCVDEAQDTSKIQHVIIRLLAGESGNLFMVGDEDQSIYGFRAAYPQALTEFDRVYPNARVLYMERNYRSAEQIVAAADRFIQKNLNRRPKHMKATRGKGPDIREISVYDRQEQYSYLCKVAQNCRSETAVLYRDNDSALPLIDQLDRAGIPYRCRQVESLFFTCRVVRDITDIIRYALDQAEVGLFLNIYYKLGAGISRILAQEAVRSGSMPLEYIASSAAASPWTKKQCRALQTHMVNLLKERGDKAVYRIVHFMGYGDYLKERGGDLRKAEILEALGAQVSTPDQLLARLEELRDVVQAGSADPACPFVLSTIHSSKGLEYDKVILMDVADGLLPRSLPQDQMEPEELDAYEEERRLFYVGMTRAKRELSLFTFRKVGLESVFSREIFPGKGQKAAPAGKKAPIAEQITAEHIEALAKDYIPGTRLLHKTFGPGTLVSKTGDIAVVVFDSQEVKKIALSTALRAKQLKLE